MASEAYIAALKAYLVVAENLGKDDIVADIDKKLEKALTETENDSESSEKETD